MQSRHQCLFVENVRKTEGNRSKMKILSSGVIFKFEEGISTSHVCLRGQQPIFQNCKIALSYFLFLEVDKSGALAPTYPPSKRKSDLCSSFLNLNQPILFT